MAVEFGLVLPAGPRKGALARYLGDLDDRLAQVERLFTGLWMTDHFFWEDEPTYEAWTVLAYIAARYPRFLIGPIVLSQSYRNPALLAKMGATLQHLSGGRLVMAVGAGWKEDEYRAYDYPFPALPVRLQQLHDTLEILKRLWTQPGRVTYHGAHYRVDDAYCEPKPDPLPPLIVGGGGPTTLKLAGTVCGLVEPVRCQLGDLQRPPRRAARGLRQRWPRLRFAAADMVRARGAGRDTG